MAKLKKHKPHPKFGATKKQADEYAATRALKNRIFELENETKRLTALVRSGITKNREDEQGIDDLFAHSVDVHLERMNQRVFWMGLTDARGHTTHIDIFMDAKVMKAKVRHDA